MLSDSLKSGEFERAISNFTNIIITDVSFNNLEYMLHLYEQYKDKFIWIDHHKPIIDFSLSNDLQNARGIRDIKHSAMYNAWRYCYPDLEIPEVIRYLSAFDSFTYEAENLTLDQVRIVNEGYNEKYKRNPELIIKMIKNMINVFNDLVDIEKYNKENIVELYNIGKESTDKLNERYAKLMSDFGDCTWKVESNNDACAIFVQEQTSSVMYDSVKNKVKHGIAFKHLKDGNWTVSLYNTNANDQFHCGEYLKEKYGGGGHQGAAGATLSQEQFIEILKNKTL